VTIFTVDGETATPLRDLTVGSNPYEIVVSQNGKWAAVSNIGRNSGDRDSVSFVDLSQKPVRTIDVLSVAPTPEGLAFSPDSRWLAVNSINGSNLKPGDPFRTNHSVLQLFDMSSGSSHPVGTAELGPNAQGLVFTPDGSTLIAQDYATDALLMFSAGPTGLTPMQTTISTEGGPSAVAVVSTRSPP
jgi:DNA-binding beta-propeller fold protein YncE